MRKINKPYRSTPKNLIKQQENSETNLKKIFKKLENNKMKLSIELVLLGWKPIMPSGKTGAAETSTASMNIEQEAGKAMLIMLGQYALTNREIAQFQLR